MIKYLTDRELKRFMSEVSDRLDSRKGTGTLLPMLEKNIRHIQGELRDRNGALIALRTPEAYLVARSYIYNHKGMQIVSCHRSVAEKAKRKERTPARSLGGRRLHGD